MRRRHPERRNVRNDPAPRRYALSHDAFHTVICQCRRYPKRCSLRVNWAVVSRAFTMLLASY